jgi:EAL domain-containing protein (putative c-di-GMP-specific phosphodiesterase class I)/GGDEF domain-containing protein
MTESPLAARTTASSDPHVIQAAVPMTRSAFAALLVRCREVHAEYVRRVATEVLSGAASALAAKEGSEDNPSVRALLMEARARVGELGGDIVSLSTAEAAARELSPIFESVFAAEQNQAASGLRLMESGELETELAINGIKIRTLRECGAEVDDVQSRLSRVFELTIDDKSNPFGIPATLDCLRPHLAKLKLDQLSERLFFSEFESVFLVRTRELFTRLRQVLSAVSPAEVAVKPTHANASREPRAALPKSIEDIGVRLYKVEQLAQLVLNEFSPKSNESGRLDTPPQANRQSPRVLDLASRLRRESVRSKNERETNPNSSKNFDPTIAIDDATLTRLIGAIDLLPHAEDQLFEESRLKEIDCLLAVAGESGASTNLDETASRVLSDSLALLKQANAEIARSSAIRPLIHSLEKSLLKLSLRDREFPSSPTHAARRVVELIDQYAIALDERGEFIDSNVKQGLTTIVEKLCVVGLVEPHAYELARTNLEYDLDQLKRERQQRVTNSREAFEARDKSRRAKATVDNVLRSALTARNVPRALIRYIGDFFRGHMQFEHINAGAESASYRSAEALVRKLIALCVEDIDLEATVAVRSEVMTAALLPLERSALDAEAKRQLQHCIHGLLAERDTTMLRDLKQAPKFENLRSFDNTGYRRWQDSVGQWWEMKVSDVWTPVQMIWASVHTGQLGFVNRSASNRVEFAAPEFERMLEQTLVRECAALDTPLFERAETALLDMNYGESLRSNNQVVGCELLSRKSMHRLLADIERTSLTGGTITVALIEFDQFREVATGAGIDAVDQLANALAEATRKALPSGATLGQFSEDCFIAIIRDYTIEGSTVALESTRRRLADFRFDFREHAFSIGISIGAAHLRVGECSETEIFRRVDAACEIARSVGRNQMSLYDASGDPRAHRPISLGQWAGRVDSLLRSDDLYLRAQLVAPIPPNLQAPYFEILLGVEDNGSQGTSTFEFVSATERLGRAYEIDLWVIANTFEWIRSNRFAFDQIGGVSINLSSASLSRVEVAARIVDELARTPVPRQKLHFEITESIAIKRFDLAQSFVRELRRQGLKVAIDDFGSGYTSYAHLKRIAADTLKIDGSYVKDLLVNDSDLAIVKSMTDIAHTLRMNVVAEWVETPEILAKLAEIGVDFAQGYAIRKPVRLRELLD